MDAGKQSLQYDKAVNNAKSVKIVFPKENSGVFNVVDDEGNMKYDGEIFGNTPNKDDNCKCPSFTNRNSTKGETLAYADTHGYAFQCKHIIAARQKRTQSN